MLSRKSLRRAFLVPALLAVFVFVGAAAQRVRADDAVAVVQEHLYAGTLKAGEAALADIVAKNGSDANAKFGLGLIRFSRAVERLAQSLHRYGLRAPQGINMPFVRMPVPENATPDVLTYEGFRAVLQDFATDLQSADAVLAEIGEAPVKLPIDLSRVRIDMAGNGAVGDDERLMSLFGSMEPGAAANPGDFLAVLDRGDVFWLRGYCHLIMASTEWFLAHDFKDLFEEEFGLFFPRAGIRDSFTRDEDRERTGYTGFDIQIADAISIVHLIHWPVAEAERMLRARDHLLQMIAMSRLSWKAILTRSDSDRHWIPGPGQTGVLRGFDVTGERVVAWLAVLDDAEAALEGRKLVPHWRFSKGINLKRVFTEPKTFDLVLWLAGPGVRPFLETGEVISSQSWDQITRAFNGDFLTYAFWFN